MSLTRYERLCRELLDDCLPRTWPVSYLLNTYDYESEEKLKEDVLLVANKSGMRFEFLVDVLYRNQPAWSD